MKYDTLEQLKNIYQKYDWEEIANTIKETKEMGLSRAMQDFASFLKGKAEECDKMDRELTNLRQSFLNIYKISSDEACFRAFEKVSGGWVESMGSFRYFLEHLSDEDREKYIENYKECYDKDFSFTYVANTYKYYEVCDTIAYYYNTKEELLDDCIDPRYLDGLDVEEELDFYKQMIVELTKEWSANE